MAKTNHKVSERDEKSTTEEISERIQEKTEASISQLALAGKEAIDRRLEELDQEWDVERCLQLNAAAISLASIFLGATRRRAWYLVPFLVSAGLLHHAINGSSPPVTLLRRWGIRTREEINHERYALKLLRGDFEDLKSVEVKDQRSSIHDTFEAIRR